MRLSKSQREKITKLVAQALPKAKDRPEIYEELQGIIEIMDQDIQLPTRLDPEEVEQANIIIEHLQDTVRRYVEEVDTNDIESLEECKRHLAINLMYLASFKDRFLYEIEYLEEVFKKEVFAKIAEEISLREGISYTQSEKKVHLDPAYNAMRLEITDLKSKLNNFKTQYDYFSKMVQVIVQSISVAGKEQYAAKMTN